MSVFPPDFSAGAMPSLLKETFAEWQDDDAMRLSAALSYYTIFALAPLLTIVIAIAGMVFGREAAQGRIVDEIGALVGPDGAEAIQSMVANAGQSGGGFAAVIGVVALLLGASALFVQLQNALNEIWNVAPKPGRGLRALVQERLLSFAMVLGIGFLLMVSLVLTAGLNAFSTMLSDALPLPTFFWQIVNFALSFAIITVLFAAIYRYLPDAIIDWVDVFTGAAITALLFVIGKFAIGFYLGHSSVGSAYGAAGSLIVILVWVYYSAMLIFFGAEFTQVFARRYGQRIRPDADAVRVVQKEVTVPDGAAASSSDRVPAPAASEYRLPQRKLEPAARPTPIVPLVGAFLIGLFFGRRGE